MAALAALAVILPANAAEDVLPAPESEIILVIEGNIKRKNVDETAQFDRAMLESIGTTSFLTSTPWYDNPVEFEGVPLDRLLDAVGATGSEMTAVALNDYQATLPLSDLGEDGAVLALKRDGKYMEIRDKGPLFIVYPYDSDSRLAAEKYYARSVWQISRLVVR
ncbi:oxidoreductase [Oricola cellulosilytica]|uniref:Oxidoreductase n=1 Tax=Oricola cellulosilytica TaxID=1429082 RepID=A0A4R0PKF4_9HYPH|nr:oxidoreductase [Oricola cellulosilytica]